MTMTCPPSPVVIRLPRRRLSCVLAALLAGAMTLSALPATAEVAAGRDRDRGQDHDRRLHRDKDGPKGHGSGNEHQVDEGTGLSTADAEDEDDDDPGAERVIRAGDSYAADEALGGPSEPAAPAMSWEAPAFATRAEAAAPLPPAAAASQVVVELFTSQGCSTCPPADALLAELAGRPGVLPLAFHVDYWDYLGWADAFARPEFTARQEAYGRSSGEQGVYTPQMIVGGEDTLLDIDPAGLESLIEAHRGAAGPVDLRAAREGADVRLTLGPRRAAAAPADVQLVRFVPRRDVRIAGGENRNRVISYNNVVISVERLAAWDGRSTLAISFKIRAAGVPDDARAAILVQQAAPRGGLGQMLTALMLD